jgi:hypothetical protein
VTTIVTLVLLGYSREVFQSTGTDHAWGLGLQTEGSSAFKKSKGDFKAVCDELGVSKTGSRSDMLERILLRLDAAEDRRPSVEAVQRALHRLCPCPRPGLTRRAEQRP